MAIARSVIRDWLPDGPATAPGNAICLVALDLQRLAATLALDEDDFTSARAWLDAHDHWMTWSGAVLGLSEGHANWARYHRLAGDAGTACQHAQQARAHASEPRQPLALVAAHRLLGELDTDAGRFDDAMQHLDASLTLADACVAPYERALTLLAMAESRAAMGQNDAARLLLEDVRAICEPLGAKPTLARVAALVARLAAPQVPLYPAGLTTREVDVLRCVAAGMTNIEIAEQLFLSVRTVEQHLRSIYNKLGSSSRTAATRFAIEHRLT